MAWNTVNAATSDPICYLFLSTPFCFVTSKQSGIVINNLYHVTKDVCYMWHEYIYGYSLIFVTDCTLNKDNHERSV